MCCTPYGGCDQHCWGISCSIVEGREDITQRVGVSPRDGPPPFYLKSAICLSRVDDITAITFTLVITWVFNNTRASVLLAILVHASIDTSSGTLGAIFPAWAVAGSLPFMIGFGAFALLTAPVVAFARTSDNPKRRGAREILL
jgi:hypothetical protein